MHPARPHQPEMRPDGITSCGSRNAVFSHHHDHAAGFTLIEVLVVVTIIALLVAILIPTLSKARERTRTVVCLANMSNLPRGVLSFAAEHRGYGQLIGRGNEAKVIDPAHTKYEYQDGFFGSAGKLFLKPWPVAYARQLGIPSLKRAENYFDKTYNRSPSYYFSKFGKQELFYCPADKDPVHSTWSPDDAYGVMSYAINEDIMGVTEPPGGDHIHVGEGQPWKDGRSGDDLPPKPIRARRLEGRLDRVIRPSEVVLFCDGGNEEGDENHRKQPTLLITNGPGPRGEVHGPYLENYEWAWARLPHKRHGPKGGIAAALADGSGKFLMPLSWKGAEGRLWVARYGPRVRVSPYNAGILPAAQP